MYERNVTWNRNYHMLYIDNPVGTGFSFTNSSDGLSTTEDEVADNLYKYLEAILFLFIFCPFSFSLLSSSSFVSLYSVYLSSSSLSSQSIWKILFISLVKWVCMYMYLCIMWCVCVLLFTVHNHVKNFCLYLCFFVACFLFLLCMHGYYHNTRVDFA